MRLSPLCFALCRVQYVEQGACFCTAAFPLLHVQHVKQTAWCF